MWLHEMRSCCADAAARCLPLSPMPCPGSIGFTRRAGGGRLVHASLRQLLARFPAAIPALLQPPSGLQQLAAAAADGGASAGGSSGEAAVAAPAAAAAAATAAATAEGGAAAPGIVALVFGREESGLLDNELLLCSHACAIPTGAGLGGRERGVWLRQHTPPR